MVHLKLPVQQNLQDKPLQEVNIWAPFYLRLTWTIVSRFCRDVDAVLMTDVGPMVTTVTWCGRTGAGTMTVAWCVGAGGVAGAKTCWEGATDHSHETDRDCVTEMHNAIVCFWLRTVWGKARKHLVRGFFFCRRHPKELKISYHNLHVL